MAKEKKLVESITSMEEDFCPVVHRCGEEGRADRLHKRKGLYGNKAGRVRSVGKYSA